MIVFWSEERFLIYEYLKESIEIELSSLIVGDSKIRNIIGLAQGKLLGIIFDYEIIILSSESLISVGKEYFS